MEGSYTEMGKFNGSLGEFLNVKCQQGVKALTYSTIPAELKNQMLDYTHKDWIADFASPTLFNVSAKLNAQSESTTGNQYLTWKTQGYKTVFDFITVRIFDLNSLKSI
jgi:hypothetical protein